MNSKRLYRGTPNERGGAGELSLPVRARAKIIRDHPVCDPGWMQQTLEMQIPAQITWTTRNSWSFLEPCTFSESGKSSARIIAVCVRKEEGDWIAKQRTQFSTRLGRTLAKW